MHRSAIQLELSLYSSKFPSMKLEICVYMYVQFELLLIDTEKFFPFMTCLLILLFNPEKPGSSFI